MDIGHNNSYRQLGRLVEMKAQNNLENGKRIFGRDITNLDKRLKKNVSIYEKVPVATKVETKTRSRSLYGHKEVLPNASVMLPARDAIMDYKQEVMDFVVRLQKVEPHDTQKHVTEKMRQILIDWLVDVHDSFELKEQTLYLALSYLSDYASLREISKEDYQLAGIACLWIASKYEEIYPPRTRNYIEVTADTYTIRDLKNMESNILEALGFDLNRTTALQLFEGMIESEPASESVRMMHEKAICLCRYALETALFEGLGKKYEPLTMVSAAMNMAENVLKHKLELRTQPTMKVNRSQMLECFKDMCMMMQANNKFDLNALRRKFGKSKNHQVAKLKLTLSE